MKTTTCPSCEKENVSVTMFMGIYYCDCCNEPFEPDFSEEI